MTLRVCIYTIDEPQWLKVDNKTNAAKCVWSATSSAPQLKMASVSCNFSLRSDTPSLSAAFSAHYSAASILRRQCARFPRTSLHSPPPPPLKISCNASSAVSAESSSLTGKISSLFALQILHDRFLNQFNNLAVKLEVSCGVRFLTWVYDFSFVELGFRRSEMLLFRFKNSFCICGWIFFMIAS